jgi:hypothetical protein
MFWVFTMLSGVLLTLLRGLVLKHLWLWFAVPLGVIPIGIAHAVGIVWLLYILHPEAQGKSSNDDKEYMVVNVIYQIISCITGWIIGYFVHLLM